MRKGYDRGAEEIFDHVDGIAKQWPKDMETEFPGLPYGAGRATDTEFVLMFEERVNGRIARNPVDFSPQIDPMTGQPIYEIPPDPWFPLALVATHEGKPVVEGGPELVARYEKARLGVMYGRTA